MVGMHEILLVEDNPDARETLRLLLELDGHRVAATDTGENAIKLALERPFSVALIDIGLPDVDGYQVAQRIRSAPAGDRVILVALTGYGRPEDIRRAREAGFDAHVIKPVDPDALTKILSGLRPKAV
jgi:CheY-like chemotaxis protein